MSRTTRSPEIEVILRCLRWAASPSPRPLVLTVDPSDLRRSDWQDIIEIGHAHRVLGFVAFALEQTGVWDRLKPAVRSCLTRSMLEAEFQNRTKLIEFKKIHRLFSEMGTPVIPLKGIDLSVRVYGDMPFRPMGDIDLLIRKNDLPEASAFLFNEGFRLRTNPPMKNRWHDRFYPEDSTPFDRHPCGRRSFEKAGLDLDLHWDPTYQIGGQSVGMDPESAWQNARPGAVLGEKILLLSPEDLSWHLILHTAQMNHSVLVQLLDLACMIRRWDPSTRTTLEQRISRLADPSKRQIEVLLGDVETLWCQIGRSLESSAAQGRELIDFVLFEKESKNYKKIKIKKGLAKISVLDRIQYLAGYFFPSPRYYLEKTGHKGVGMYWKHWNDLIKKAGRVFLRRIRDR